MTFLDLRLKEQRLVMQHILTRASLSAYGKMETYLYCKWEVPLSSLRPLQLQCYQVVRIRALELNLVTFPPREIPSKLESRQTGKDIMIEESTQPARIVTADLKCITFLMTRIAFSLHSRNGGHHFVSYPRIFCHFKMSPFPYFGCSKIFSEIDRRA